MGNGIDLARADAPLHAAVLDDLKDQLIIVLMKRLVGKDGRLDISVEEIDATGSHNLAFSIENRVFKFQLLKKH